MNTDKKSTASTPSTTAPTVSGQAKLPTNGTQVSPGNGTPVPAAASPDASPPAGPAPAPAATDPAGAGPGAPQADDESDPLLYFIVTGPINSFKTVAKAEKFLNEPGAPTEYTVIRGRAAPAKKRVSLRG